MAAPIGLFSLSSSDSDSDGAQPQARSTAPASAPPAAAASASSVAVAKAVLADMETSDDEETSSDDDDALVAPRQQANRPPPPTKPASMSTAAASSTPVAPVPSATPSSSSISISAPSGLKFKLSLGSAKQSTAAGHVPQPMEVSTNEDTPAQTRKRRAPKPKATADDNAGAETAPPSTGKRKRASGGTSAKKRSKKSSAAAEPALPPGPVIVQRIVWLQCDDKMCSKWRSMTVSQFNDRELKFTGDIAKPTAEHAKTLPASAAPPDLPLPTFLSHFPLTFDDLSKMTFYCWMNPNLAYARCSAEEEVTAQNEIVIETS